MQSDGTMTSRQYRRMQKRCRECGKRDAYTEAGRLYCAECRIRANELQRGMSEEQKVHKYAGEKALREARKAAGICPKCGKREITAGYLTCDICRSKKPNENAQGSGLCRSDGHNGSFSARIMHTMPKKRTGRRKETLLRMRCVVGRCQKPRKS